MQLYEGTGMHGAATMHRLQLQLGIHVLISLSESCGCISTYLSVTPNTLHTDTTHTDNTRACTRYRRTWYNLYELDQVLLATPSTSGVKIDGIRRRSNRPVLSILDQQSQLYCTLKLMWLLNMHSSGDRCRCISRSCTLRKDRSI